MLAVPNKKVETIVAMVPELQDALEQDLQPGTVTYVGSWRLR